MKKTISLALSLLVTLIFMACLDNQASYENCNSVTGSCEQASTSEQKNEADLAVPSDTVIKTVIDTVTKTVDKYIHDTTTVEKIDTIKIEIKDTVIVKDTIVNTDTLYIKADTVVTSDTTIKVDTLIKIDTLIKVDTLFQHDTTIVNDTTVTMDTTSKCRRSL